MNPNWPSGLDVQHKLASQSKDKQAEQGQAPRNIEGCQLAHRYKTSTPPRVRHLFASLVILEQDVVLCQNFLALLLGELFRHSIHSCMEALPQLSQVSLQRGTELGGPTTGAKAP